MKRLGLAILLVLTAAPAAHALTQPSGAVIPAQMGCGGGKPTGLAATFACTCTTAGICNIGAVCTGPTSCDDGMRGTCETTLSHAYNDNTCIPSNLSGLDPYSEAALTPETFRPSCALTFTVGSRGTAIFKNVFGWYNVTASAPQPGDLHVMIDCNAQPGTAVTADIARDPAYTGGEIGFFIATPESHTQRTTCAGGNCCATLARLGAGEGYVYYSQRRFNADSTGANPFIHLLIYDSHLRPRKFYFAWEDIYGGQSSDFSDFVTGVEGVECSGGGEACDTGKKGVCAYGVSKCTMGALSCVDVGQPGPEACDGLDNDCNGIVDDGATCPRANEVCSNGRCVPHCALDQEFACPTGTSCNPATGICIAGACAGVSCPADQICRSGTCVAPCAGVVCPFSQVCRNDHCFDPCAGMVCGNGEICSQGLCVPGCGQCGGLMCGAGKRCDAATGRCTDASCAAACPAGSHCAAGACHDDCEGAACPGGKVCQAGECADPTGPGMLQADGGNALAGDAGTGTGDGPGHSGGCSGCASGHSGPEGAALPLGLCFAILRRRRRK